jgi:predicted O-linked N-acetylglucosamine transferase (SPINDLY family)
MDHRRAGWLKQAREHHRGGRLDEAAALYRRVLQADPEYVDALIGLADVLEALGRGGEAVALLGEAVDRSPGSAALRGRLADAHHVQGDLPAAIEAYRQAVALDPTLAGAWWGLGCALARLDDHAAAAESLRRLVALKPDHGMALHNLGKSLFELGQVDPALEAFRRSLDHLPEEMRCLALGNIAVAIPGASSARNRDILEARRAWATYCLPPAAPPRRIGDRGPVASRPIRQGYVSAFFSRRNWMKPVWGLINHHDRDRFEVHLFSDGPASAIGGEYRRDPRDRFHEVKALSNPDLARLIEEHEIDLLIDLNGYSRPSRLPLFALRPAPVQVSWFNMFATSGLDSFDYLIGDEHVIPREEEPFYTERVVRVPGSYLTFEVTYPVPDVGPPPCLKTGTLTFGSLAPQYKITTEVVEAWSAILRGASRSRLILKSVLLGQPSARNFVLDLFARSGIAPERVELDGPAEHFTFLKRYDDIDIALDTFPYNGGTTTMEALWQGVPVLTFTGDRWAARISASLVLEAGLPDFVAANLDGFVKQGVALASDPAIADRLTELRGTMRARLETSPVCHTALFARNMEASFAEMIRRSEERSNLAGRLRDDTRRST